MAREGSYQHLVFAFILISLFSFLILSAIGNMALTYEKDTSNVLGGSLNIDDFNESLESFNSSSRSFRERYEKGSKWSAVVGIVVDGIFKIAVDMFGMIIFPFNLISAILINIIGVPSIVVNTLFGLLIITMIFAIWRLIKIGN